MKRIFISTAHEKKERICQFKSHIQVQMIAGELHAGFVSLFLIPFSFSHPHISYFNAKHLKQRYEVELHETAYIWHNRESLPKEIYEKSSTKIYAVLIDEVTTKSIRQKKNIAVGVDGGVIYWMTRMYVRLLTGVDNRNKILLLSNSVAYYV